jgi:SpoVK/Ycf46/Vps4 family AAA+-type ATPase
VLDRASWQSPQRRRRAFALGAGLLLAVYAMGAVALDANRDFGEVGPLSLRQPPLETGLPGAIGLDEVPARCLPDASPEERAGGLVKVVGGPVDGRQYYACYLLFDDGDVNRARVVDAHGFVVTDAEVIKRGGAWPWIGLVKSTQDLVAGGIGLALALWWCWRYYRRPRPGPARSGRAAVTDRLVLAALVLLAPVGWLLAAGAGPGRRVGRARRLRLFMLAQLVWAWLVLAVLWLGLRPPGDTWAAWVLGLLAAGLLYGGLAGRRLVAPPGFGTPDGAPVQAAQPPPAAPAPVVTTTAPAPAAGPKATPPGRLPTFAQVGGMDALKAELRDTVGLLLAFAGEADVYRLSWNGILLHGPPGVGKSFLAKATAGEFGLALLHVATGDLVSAYSGGSAANVERVFRAAAANIPCLLFFDEFDSVAQRRDDWPDQEARRTVNQLLQSLETYRPVRELVVMAATNDLEGLDPAVIRPGRFDRHVRVDLPDQAARASILAAQLRGRPAAARLDLDELAERTEGLTPAALAQVVEAAALDAFRAASLSGHVVELTTDHLLRALERRGGSDRPTVEHWSWDQLVLPEDVKEELREIQALVEDPERGRAYGLGPPSGLLLTGPPGTGKTTIARVLAAQARCSFYPVSGADVTSKWLGESERAIQRLFERARANRPAIVFLDEIDAIAGRRDEPDSYGPQVNELLEELDGVAGRSGVLVIGATNRPDRLDPAILRGGRLARTIQIPLPDPAGRRRLLELMTERMPLVAVDLDHLVERTEGWSGADLRALCQQAALNGLVRDRRAITNHRPGLAELPPAVLTTDFDEAFSELGRRSGTGQPIGT